MYVRYLTLIINYHLHFDFLVSHPSFFCLSLSDVDVRSVLGVRSVDPVTTPGIITVVSECLDPPDPPLSCVTHNL